MNNPNVRYIPPVPQWLLVEVYMDIASGCHYFKGNIQSSRVRKEA